MAGQTTYREIKRELLRRIHDGVYPPGALLPAETDLCADFGCARATVNRALRELSEDGIVARKRKAGTRVNRSPVREARFRIPLVRDEIERSGAVYRYTLLKREVLEAPDWLRARLGLEAASRVLHLHCLHRADDAPFQFEDRWIAIAAVPRVEGVDFVEAGPNEWLVAEVPFTEVEISFSARAADAALARFLDVSPGDPLFTAERATWLSGRAVTFVRLSFAAGYALRTRY